MKKVLFIFRYFSMVVLTITNIIILYSYKLDIYAAIHSTVNAKFTEKESNSSWLYQSENFYLTYMITLIITSCLLIIFSFFKINKKPIIAFSAQSIPIVYFIVDVLTNFTQQ